MYIKEEDFNYFEGLYKSFDEVKRKEFIEALLKSGIKRRGQNITKIQVIGDEVFNERAIEPEEMITRTMIKKAYKASKEDK